MKFCGECGGAMVKVDSEWACRSCDPEEIPEKINENTVPAPSPRTGSIEELPTTASGNVSKSDAMEWLQSLARPSDSELQEAIVPKPSDFSGSTYPTSISNIRITGDPAFLETMAGLFKPILELENSSTRVEINLKETEDRDTGEETGNYALYLSVAERG